MNQEWDLKKRADCCCATGRQFADGESYYTLLFRERDGYRREDISEEAWAARGTENPPFSFWRAKYQAPPAVAPEAMPPQSAEDLLRSLMLEDDPSQTNARFILAVMLERKRTLKPVESKQTESGRLLIYEHAKTGEIFLIPDPGLRLEQVEAVQHEVAALLGAKPPAAPQETQPEQ